MKKFEYKVVHRKALGIHDGVPGKLNDFGEDGWEFMWYEYPLFVFKREKVAEKPEHVTDTNAFLDEIGFPRKEQSEPGLLDDAGVGDLFVTACGFVVRLASRRRNREDGRFVETFSFATFDVLHKPMITFTVTADGKTYGFSNDALAVVSKYVPYEED